MYRAATGAETHRIGDVAAAQSAVLVAGMHRSGTSVLTRTLSLLGCALPNTTLSSVWESKVIIRLDQQMLASAGCGWDDWKPFYAHWHSTPIAKAFRKCAEAALRDEFGSAPLFVLKDPRICRVLPIWTEAAKNLGIAPAVILPIRNPLEVAASLEMRDGVNPSVGQLLWLRYVLEAEHASRGFRRAFIRYDDLLADWQAAVQGLSQTLGISWTRPLASAVGDIEACISSAKRHHQVDDAMIFGDQSLSAWLKSTFEILSRWTRDEIRETDTAELDRIKLNFDEAAGLFNRIALANPPFHQRVDELKAKLEKRNARIRRLTAKLAAQRNESAEERRASISQSIGRRKTRALRLMARFARRVLQIRALKV